MKTVAPPFSPVNAYGMGVMLEYTSTDTNMNGCPSAVTRTDAFRFRRVEVEE